MHVPINVKSPNNISEWQMGFNSAFKGLKCVSLQRLLCISVQSLLTLSLNLHSLFRLLCFFRNRGGKLAIETRFCFLVDGWTSDLDAYIIFGSLGLMFM